MFNKSGNKAGPLTCLINHIVRILWHLFGTRAPDTCRKCSRKSVKIISQTASEFGDICKCMWNLASQLPKSLVPSWEEQTSKFFLFWCCAVGDQTVAPRTPSRPSDHCCPSWSIKWTSLETVSQRELKFYRKLLILTFLKFSFFFQIALNFYEFPLIHGFRRLCPRNFLHDFFSETQSLSAERPSEHTH